MKKILSIALVVVLLAGIAISGTMAYLTDTDSAVNVMTLGNVKIEQIELERKEQSDDNVTSENLKKFSQAKPLYPAVGTLAWAKDYQEWATGGSNQLFTADLKNVQDKFVFVENTGKSDAYVRTFVAFEQGSMTEEEFEAAVGQNINEGFWTWETVGYGVKIKDADGVEGTYAIKVATYKGNEAVHKDGILPAGETTRPSLLQVLLYSTATNEDVAKLDGNGNDTYDILVLSQAVQTNGFDNAQTALDTAWGEPDALNAAGVMNVVAWFTGLETPIKYDYEVGTLDALKAAFDKGGNIMLTDDIEFEKITAIEPGREVYLNLNGKTITVDENTQSNTMIWVKDGAKLTIDGNGTIDLGSVSTMAIFCPYGELVIENGTFTRNEVTEVTNATTGLFMGAKSSGCNVTINGGYFDPGYYDENAADIESILAGTKEFTETADDIAKRGNSKDANLVRVAIKDNVSVLLNHSGYGSFKVYGGTFVGANPAWGDEGCMLPTTPNYLRPWSYYQGALLDGQTFKENGLVIPTGYTITQSANADGVPVYTVSYSK